MEVLPIARKLHSYGLTKLADKLVTKKYGAQIGKTSKAGYRTFCSNEGEPIFVDISARMIGEIDNLLPEKIITGIDKDYNLVGQTIIRRMHENTTNYDCTQVERRLLPKSNDPAQTHRLDITQYQGLGSQIQPGRHVISRHHISRNALEPEVVYSSGKPWRRFKQGERIYDQFNYSYMPKDKNGNIIMSYHYIGCASGGETFYNNIHNMIDGWHEHNRVIRDTKNSI